MRLLEKYRKKYSELDRMLLEAEADAQTSKYPSTYEEIVADIERQIREKENNLLKVCAN